MASSGTHGHGSSLAGGTVGDVGSIISMSVDGQTRDPIDISTMDSTNKFREFISGMADAGEITVEINYNGASGASANDLQTAYALGSAEEWTFTMPDTSKLVVQGFITSLGIAVPFDDKITQSFTIKLTGVPVYTDVP